MKPEDMTKDQVHDALEAKIRAAWPGVLSEDQERTIALGSNDDLRRLVAIAEVAGKLVVKGSAPEETYSASNVHHLKGKWTLDGHDFRHSYILARDMYESVQYEGPDWAPFNLWQAAEDSYGAQCDAARTLLYSPKCKELWARIAEKYERPDNIALTLPMRCAEFQHAWEMIPKQKPAEFRDDQLAIQRKAEQLAAELERFYARWDYDNGAPPIDFNDLFSPEEELEANRRIRQHNHGIANRALQKQGHRGLDWDNGAHVDVFDTWGLLIGAHGERGGIVPKLPELVRRVGSLFADEAKTVHLERPKGANTARNYFARRLIGYFTRETGLVSPAIVAAIASMFFAEPMTDNDVQGQMDRLPSGKLMQDGEG